MASGSSAVVEPLTHNPKISGCIPAAVGTRRERVEKSIIVW